MPKGVPKNGINKGWFKVGVPNKNKGKKTGKSSWNKGLKNFMSEDGKKRMIKSKIGEPLSEEHKRKIGIANKGKRSGSKCNFWNGGVSLINDKHDSRECFLWVKNVYKKDLYTCRRCGYKGKNLNAHHVKNFTQEKNLRYVLENGITLCKNCHVLFHKTYGKKNNDIWQINEFLKTNK